MYDSYIYASYGVTFALLGLLIIASLRGLRKARRDADKLAQK